MNDSTYSDRFERVPPAFEVASREFKRNGRIQNRINLQSTNDTGDFLSRLWAVFGPPDDVQPEGFTYALRDRETGLTFRAYCAGSGPAYGGFQEEAAALEPVLKAFDTLLQNTMPVDCEIEFDTDFGLYQTGAKDGVPFGRMISTVESDSDANATPTNDMRPIDPDIWTNLWNTAVRTDQ